MAPRVLPTRYKGVDYRSRLEAKWAVFFDRLRIRNLYEPEPFKLADGSCYTPDFFLPKFGGRHGTFVEVRPDGDLFLQPRRFALETDALVWLCDDEPAARTYTVLQRFTLELADSGRMVTDVTEEDAVPLIGTGRARKHGGFYYLPAFEFSESMARSWGEVEYLAAIDAAHAHRFWDPQPEVR